jgi:outer membrane biosynthesis protein TonB
MERPSALRALPSLLVVTLVITLLVATSPAAVARNKRPKFTPPELLTAASINYPINSSASGVVAVAIYLDDAGKVTATDTLRDIPSLTAPVLLSIQKWTFKPATLDGKEVDSTIVASIAFNPADYRLAGTDTPVLGKELKVLSRDADGFLPPHLATASWALYPLNSVERGSVILDARVGRDGGVRHVTPVWSPYLKTTSVEAAKKWTFEPATFDGMPTDADVIIGYVFRLPNIASPVARP